MDLIFSLRQFRIGPFAIFDFAVSYLVVFLFSPLLSKTARIFRLSISRIELLWLVLPISVFVHIIVGQETSLTQMFTGDGYWTVKAIVVFMLFMGVRGMSVLKK